MFAYFKRRQHEKATLETLYSVLSLYPHGPQRVLTDYQGIREAINDHYKNGVPAPKSAVMIAAMVLVELRVARPRRADNAQGASRGN